MKYPGGFADEALISPETLNRLFPGISQEGWEAFAAKEELPLQRSEAGWSGPSLPFLILLGLKGEALSAEAYYRLLEEALGNPAMRGKLEEVVRKLGSWATSPSLKPPPRERSKPDLPVEEQKASRIPEKAQDSISPPSESPPPPSPSMSSPSPSPTPKDGGSSPWDAAISLMVAAIGGLEERLRATEELLASWQTEVASLREEVARLRDEMEVWNDHVRYLNDRYAKVEEGLKAEREAREKALSDLASRLQGLDNLIRQIRQAVLPR